MQMRVLSGNTLTGTPRNNVYLGAGSQSGSHGLDFSTGAQETLPQTNRRNVKRVGFSAALSTTF